MMDKNNQKLQAISRAVVGSRNSIGSPKYNSLLITLVVISLFGGLSLWFASYQIIPIIGAFIFVGLAAHDYLTRQLYKFHTWNDYIVSLIINYTPCNKDAYLCLLAHIESGDCLNTDTITEWIAKEKNCMN